MKILAIIFTLLVTIEHNYILCMEMFAWETAGKKTFGKSLSHDLFKPTKALAANQGLYSGFLVAGIIWSFLIENQEWSINVRLFFLSCVAVAVITASRKIFFVQAVPALLAILFTILLI